MGIQPGCGDIDAAVSACAARTKDTVRMRPGDQDRDVQARQRSDSHPATLPARRRSSPPYRRRSRPIVARPFTATTCLWHRAGGHSAMNLSWLVAGRGEPLIKWAARQDHSCRAPPSRRSSVWGFLAGDMKDKVDPTCSTLYDALNDFPARQAAAEADEEKDHRDRAAGLHARPHADRAPMLVL